LTVTIPLVVFGARPAARLVPFVIAGYYFASVRRVFGASWWQAAWKGTLTMTVYVLLVLVTMVAIGLRTSRYDSPFPAAARTGQGIPHAPSPP
jgi:cytosine/uracil/thiamine/allantoin permease